MYKSATLQVKCEFISGRRPSTLALSNRGISASHYNVQRWSSSLRTHGLRVRLLSIAVIAGLCITAVLLGLEYFEYRKSIDSIGAHGERSLLTAESERLARETGDLVATQVPSLEASLGRKDASAIKRIGDSLLAAPIVTSVLINDVSGKPVYQQRKPDAWVNRLSSEEQSSLHQTLGQQASLGMIEVQSGRAGLRASAMVSCEPNQ